MRLVLATFLVLSLVGSVSATNLSPVEKPDPITGDPVNVSEIVSYGSYIYDGPSKYDMVFWPLTTEEWISINPKSGYGAFAPDFDRLPKEEKEPLAKWLKANYDPAKPPPLHSHAEKLAWLEKVYGQRKMKEPFWRRFYCLSAYVRRDNKKKSLEYVKKAIPLLEKEWKANPKDTKRLELLFLLGEYYRRLGNKEKAVEYFSQVKTVEYKDRDGKKRTGHPYFVGLVDDRRKLIDQEPSNPSTAEVGK